ncbi:MAG: hypothetical protein KatS3mg028_0194 [Bacteroidia bacterium]|nr:MAG: hypothetical protein KatS3mg028_0194 [Bacteroidia bacterium]
MIKYNKYLKENARYLRKNSTIGEILLWSKSLKSRKMLGYQFNRQFPLNICSHKNVIVDFICRQLKLIIEIDGYSHLFKYEDDIKRDKILEQNGYTVLRFREKEVRRNITEVVRIIQNTIEELEKKKNPPSTHPLLNENNKKTSIFDKRGKREI